MARAKRGATIWLVAMIVVTTLAMTVRAQYGEGSLPAGVRSVTVDGQPIDSVTKPETGNRSPEFAGRVDPGPTELALSIVDAGSVVSTFVVPVDDKGRFKGATPDKLDAKTYALYLNDVLIGEFVITGDGEGRPRGQAGLDLARIAPRPSEFTNLPNAGVVLDGSLQGTRYFDLQEEAQRIGAANGDTSREAVTAIEKQLQDAGWVQRYTHVVASPRAEDPNLFEVEVNTVIYQYADPANAEAALGVIAALPGEPVADAPAIGDGSDIKQFSDILPDTGAAYQAVRMGFRQDRVFVLMIYADLLNRQPDLATLVAIAQAMQGRAAAVLAGEGTSLSPLALRLDLTKSGGQPKIRESYEVVDGVVVARYSEKRGPREAREASYAGAPIVYGAGFAGKTGGQGDAAASDAAALGLSYTVTLYGFPDEGSANAWLVDLPNRPRDEAGYLSWAHFPEAPPYGAASITYQFSRKAGGEATERGFRVYFQVGAVIASIDYATTGEPTLAEVEELVNAQIKCIEKGGCSGSAPIPGAAESGGRGDRQDGGQDGSGQDAGAEQG